MTTAESETIDFGEVGKKPQGSIFMPMVQLGIHPRIGNQTRIYLMRNGEPCDRITPAWKQTRPFVIHNAYRQIDLNQPPTVINRWLPAV
uniref:Uncharacterized protein n=1 Tax=Ditylenchus dipsaci TaxID=166011 RepID=A0A915EG37_9BILA